MNTSLFSHKSYQRTHLYIKHHPGPPPYPAKYHPPPRRPSSVLNMSSSEISTLSVAFDWFFDHCTSIEWMVS